MTSVTADLERRLDSFEDDLPPLASSLVRGQRAIGGLILRTAAFSTRATVDSLRAVARTAQTAVNTVVGTARRQADNVAERTAVGARTTVGQAKAQSRRTTERARTEAARGTQRVGETLTSARQSVEDVLDDTAHALDRASGSVGPFEKWTRSDLYARAQELDVDGRSTMNKKQLIRALRQRG
jgi:hypothetical protein